MHREGQKEEEQPLPAPSSGHWSAEYIRPVRLLLIALFGIAGGLCRYFITLAATEGLGIDSFYGVIVANMLGCTLMGVVHVVGVEKDWLPKDLRVGIMVGMLGGLTTFSSYALDSVLLLERGADGDADGGGAKYVGAGIANLVLQPVVGLALMCSSIYLTRRACESWESSSKKKKKKTATVERTVAATPTAIAEGGDRFGRVEDGENKIRGNGREMEMVEKEVA